MKKIFFLISLLFWSVLSYGQMKIFTDNIYLTSLSKFISYLDSVYGNTEKMLFFDNLPGVTFYLPTTINKHKITYLSEFDKEEKLKTQTTIVMYEIFPMVKKEDKFYVPFSTYNITKNGSVVIATWHFIYSYDCINDRFIYLTVVGGGF